MVYKMMYFIALVLATLVSNEARTFNNPILSDRSYFESNAIKVNGTYYLFTRILNTTDEIFPIHTSTDLIDWKLSGYVFDDSNIPPWAQKSTLKSPTFQPIGTKFAIYFSAYPALDPYDQIGVVTASHPLGPYTSPEYPVVLYSDSPSTINDEEKVHLMWRNVADIIARQLDKNGLYFAFPSANVILLRPTLPWEEGVVIYPWHMRRGKYNYLLYNGGLNCNGIGVARSTQALGPYEKLSDPIIVSKFCLSDVSVVKDVDNQSDVIFFTAKVNGSWAVVLASLYWDDNDWPVIGQL